MRVRSGIVNYDRDVSRHGGDTYTCTYRRYRVYRRITPRAANRKCSAFSMQRPPSTGTAARRASSVRVDPGTRLTAAERKSGRDCGDRFKTRSNQSKNVMSPRPRRAAHQTAAEQQGGFTADQSKRPARLHAPAGPIRPVSKEVISGPRRRGRADAARRPPPHRSAHLCAAPAHRRADKPTNAPRRDVDLRQIRPERPDVVPEVAEGAVRGAAARRTSAQAREAEAKKGELEAELDQEDDDAADDVQFEDYEPLWLKGQEAPRPGRGERVLSAGRRRSHLITAFEARCGVVKEGARTCSWRPWPTRTCASARTWKMGRDGASLATARASAGPGTSRYRGAAGLEVRKHLWISVSNDLKFDAERAGPWVWKYSRPIAGQCASRSMRRPFLSVGRGDGVREQGQRRVDGVGPTRWRSATETPTRPTHAPSTRHTHAPTRRPRPPEAGRRLRHRFLWARRAADR